MPYEGEEKRNGFHKYLTRISITKSHGELIVVHNYRRVSGIVLSLMGTQRVVCAEKLLFSLCGYVGAIHLDEWHPRRITK